MFEIKNYAYKFSDTKYLLTSEQAIALKEEIDERSKSEYIYLSGWSYPNESIIVNTSEVHEQHMLGDDRCCMSLERICLGAITPIIENGKTIGIKEDYDKISIGYFGSFKAPYEYTKQYLFSKTLNGRPIEVETTNCTRMGLPLNTCVMTTRIADIDITGYELYAYYNSLDNDYDLPIYRDDIKQNHNYKICMETVVYTNPDGTPHCDEYDDNKPSKPKIWSKKVFDLDDEYDRQHYDKWVNQPFVNKDKDDNCDDDDCNNDNRNKALEDLKVWEKENIPDTIIEYTKMAFEQYELGDNTCAALDYFENLSFEEFVCRDGYIDGTYPPDDIADGVLADS